MTDLLNDERLGKVGWALSAIRLFLCWSFCYALIRSSLKKLIMALLNDEGLKRRIPIGFSPSLI